MYVYICLRGRLQLFTVDAHTPSCDIHIIILSTQLYVYTPGWGRGRDLCMQCSLAYPDCRLEESNQRSSCQDFDALTNWPTRPQSRLGFMINTFWEHFMGCFSQVWFQRKVTFIVLRDLSAANQWFQSYLTDRQQQVRIGDSLSRPLPLETGVPQGSGGGPQLYNKYTRPLGAILLLLAVLYHFFADDSQVYKSVNPNSIKDQYSTRSIIENALRVISDWMLS